MLNKSKKNIIIVTSANFLKLLSTLFLAFYIPRLLGLNDYGLYKLYVLYASFLGFFHFGIIDGIYLKYGGLSSDELDKKMFRSFFSFFIKLQFAVFFSLIFSAFLFLNGDLKIILLLLSLDLIAINIISYFQYISQITGRFSEYTLRLLILTVSEIFILLIMHLININTYSIYIIFKISINFVMSIWYVATYRDLVLGIKYKLRDLKSEIGSLFKIGIPLMLSNIVVSLLVSIDKQFVSYYFGNTMFAIYSIAFSLIAMSNVLIASISIVLYPDFKKIELNVLLNKKSKLNKIIIDIIVLGSLVYYPVSLIIIRFLPEYIASIDVFRIIYPSLLFTAPISAILHNYYKVSGDNKKFLLLGFIVMLIISVSFAVGVHLKSSLSLLSFIYVISMSIWYLLVNYSIKTEDKKTEAKNIVTIIVFTIFFYSLSIFKSFVTGFVVQALIVLVYLYLNNLELIKNIQRRIKK